MRIKNSTPLRSLPTMIDDEHREPMGLAERDSCRECHEAILRTTSPGLCWRCMPCRVA